MVTTNVKQQALKCAEGMVRQPVLGGMCGRLIAEFYEFPSAHISGTSPGRGHARIS